ncbi:MAG: hypothetical protein ACI36W_00495, partial [Coriobacteriales bacterium]
ADGVVQGAQEVPIPAQLPFTASYNGQELPVVKVVQGGYEYTEFGKPEPTAVDVYVVAVPASCTAVDLRLTEASILYNYSEEGEYLAGYLADPTVGTLSASVQVDSPQTNMDGSVGAPADGKYDFIQVQNPYSPDWTGGELKYAITFESPLPVAFPQRISSNTNLKVLKKAAVDKKKRVVSFSVTGAQTQLRYLRGPASKKAGLKVDVTSTGTVKVTVPKGTKAGSYKLTVWAKKKEGEYKTSNKLTFKIKVVKNIAVAE